VVSTAFIRDFLIGEADIASFSCFIRSHLLQQVEHSHKALIEAGHDVRVIAPKAEQSAVGHAITIRDPLRAKEYRENGFLGYGISGTPADCVKLGISVLLDEEPDIVLSSINAGANVGPDIMYSGTVATARESAAMGYSAIALSYDSFTPGDLTEYVKYAVELMSRIPPGRKFRKSAS
jgi:5'-nucleotidase